MQFTVPQFIEHDPKIFGPLTFKQAIFVGVAVAIDFIFYFAVGKNNFMLFILVAALTTFVALAFAFIKINGRSLTAAFLNILSFVSKQKIYLWNRKGIGPKSMKKIVKKEPEKKDSTSLKFAEKSRLKNLSSQIEINP